MILTDADKALAKELGLTLEEMRIAKAVRISPERYAFRKAEIQAGRGAKQAHDEQFGTAMVERAAAFQAGGPIGRGERPNLEAGGEGEA